MAREDDDNDFVQPCHLITLREFFPKVFLNDDCEVVTCHTVNAFEKDNSSSSSPQVVIKSEDLPSFNINELLALSQTSKDVTIEMLKDSNVSNVKDTHISACASHCMSIIFTNEDLMLRSKHHNRSLFDSSYIREQKVGWILIDDGSTVNIMPKSTMPQIGILIDELSKNRLVIQGFNQGGWRAIGMICLELIIGNLKVNTLFHIIDSKTTYRLLLGCSWIRGNGVISSTLHQCFKFYQNGVKKVEAGLNLSLEAE